MLGALLSLGCVGFMTWLILKLFIPPPKQDDNDIKNFNIISNSLDKMQQTKERLKELEDLITDLTALDDDCQRYTIEWHDLNTNKRHSYDFMLIDKESKDHLLSLAKLERKYLRSSLSSDIENLRSYVTKTKR